MTCAKKIGVIFCLLVMAVISCTPSLSAEEKESKVLLLYHEGYTNEQINMPALVHLLSRFQMVETINVDQKSVDRSAISNRLTSFSRIVYLGDREKKRKLPQDWKQLVNQLVLPLYMIGDHPSLYVHDLSYKENGSFQSGISLYYRGKDYPLDISLNIPKSEVIHPDKVTIHSWLDNGSERVPFILSGRETKNNRMVFYCASFDIEGLIGNTIADSLFDFFQWKGRESHQVFIRIEDVHPLREPEEIIGITDYLASKKIPFMIAVIPIYRENNTKISLSDRPKLVKALQYAQDHGGTIVMHGTTHQYYDDQSGEGYEFWDHRKKAPIANEKVYIQEKIELGLQILLENKLYPIAFEPPHYAMTTNGYSIVSEYFSGVVANVQLTDTSYFVQAPPYPFYHYRVNKLHFFPENGGYLEEDSPIAISKIVSNLESSFMVRQSMTGFFFHPFMPLDRLKQVVESMEKMNLSYFDIRSESLEVRTPWGLIETKENKVLFSQQRKIPQQKEQEQLSISQQVSNIFSWGIVIIVTLVILSFVVQVRLLRRRRASRLFMEIKIEKRASYER